jgi:hypothetical protein
MNILSLYNSHAILSFYFVPTGANSLAAWPFVNCLVANEHGHPAYGESCYSSTMGPSPQVSWDTIVNCYQHESQATQQIAKQGEKPFADLLYSYDINYNSIYTFYPATPKHEYTAWIIVNHVHLVDANALLSTICAAYTGPKPPSCEQHQLSKHMDMIRTPENKEFNDAIDKRSWGCANEWSPERQ